MANDISGLPVEIKQRVNATVAKRAEEANAYSTLPAASRFDDKQLSSQTQDLYLQQQRDLHHEQNQQLRTFARGGR